MFHACKGGHTATTNEVCFTTFEPSVFPCRVCVDEEDPEWGIKREVVHEIGGFCLCGIAEGTSRVCITHAKDILVHVGPVVA